MSTYTDLQALESKAVSFGHESVGAYIMDGVQSLIDSNGVGSIIVGGSEDGVGRWAAWYLNNYGPGNGDPEGKCQSFRNYIEQYSDSIEIAFFKFCYVDIYSGGSASTGRSPYDLAQYYIDFLEQIKSDFPSITFVAWTSPVMSQANDADNAARNEYNNYIRDYYGNSSGYGPHGWLFDLAYVESDSGSNIDSDGNQLLVSSWSSDSGHPDQNGSQEIIAAALINVLAQITGAPPSGTPPTISAFSRDPSGDVTAGTTVTFSWTVSNFDTITLDGVDVTNKTNVAGSGSDSIVINATKTIVLRATNGDGSTSRSSTVTVGGGGGGTGFRFVTWGDTKGGTSTLASLSNQIVNLGLDPVFTLYAGDCVDIGFSTDPMNAWRSALDGDSGNGIANKTLPIRGNHDVENGMDPASGWDDFFNTIGTIEAFGGTNIYLDRSVNWSFDYGNSHFVGVDIPGDANDSTLVTQSILDFIDNDLTDAENRGLTHAFLMWHGPLITVTDEHHFDAYNDPVVRLLIDVLNAHNIVSAIFVGHEHCTAWVHITSSKISNVTHDFEQFTNGAAGAGNYSISYFDLTNDYLGDVQAFATVDVDGQSFTVSWYEEGASQPTWSRTFQKSGGAGTVPVSSVDISPTSDTVALNATRQFQALINPSNATNQGVTWEVVEGASYGTIGTTGLYQAPASLPRPLGYSNTNLLPSSIITSPTWDRNAVTIGAAVNGEVPISESNNTDEWRFIQYEPGNWPAAFAHTYYLVFEIKAGNRTHLWAEMYSGNSYWPGANIHLENNTGIVYLEGAPQAKGVSITPKGSGWYEVVLAAEYVDVGSPYYGINIGSYHDWGTYGGVSFYLRNVQCFADAPTGTLPPLVNLKAFPGAEGSGALSKGGWGGRGNGNASVYIVNTLEDGKSLGGTGVDGRPKVTLRDAIDASGPRIVLFRVSGVIQIDNDLGALMVENPYISILGQSAPGKGITLIRPGPGVSAGAAPWSVVLQIKTHDVIVRYLRLRHLAEGLDPSVFQENVGNLIIESPTQDSIFDHLSCSWSADDSVDLSSYSTSSAPLKNVTVQWLMEGEGVNGTGGNWQNTSPFLGGEGMDDAGDVDFHHCVISAVHHRVPFCTLPKVRWVNNLCQPISDDTKGTASIANSAIDFIGNLWELAADDPGDDSYRPWAIGVSSKTEQGEASDPDIIPSIYVHGNAGHTCLASDNDATQWTKLVFHAPVANYNWSSQPPENGPAEWRRANALSALTIPITAETADDSLRTKLWNGAGASQRLDGNGVWQNAKDLFDIGLHTRSINRTGLDPQTEEDSAYDATNSKWSTVRADIEANAASYATDSNNNGIPNAWEIYWTGKAVGPNGATTTAQNIADPNYTWGDGYTNIEHYLSGNFPVGAANAGINGGMNGTSGSSSGGGETGANYYVDPAGSDSNSGTSSATPWKTLAKVNAALSDMSAGTVIAFKAGSSFTGTLDITTAGLTFKSYGTGAKPLIESNNNLSTVESYIIGISANTTTIDGLAIHNSTPGLPDGGANDYEVSNPYGIGISANSCIIKNCEIYNTGIGIGVFGDSNVISNNYIHDLRMMVNDEAADNDYGAEGILLEGSSNDIHHNTFRNFRCRSYDYTWDGAGFEIFNGGSALDDNLIHHNWVENVDAFTEFSGEAARNKFYYNVVTNITGSFATIHGGTTEDANEFVNNTVWPTSGNMTQYPAIWFGEAADTTIFKNNIIVLGTCNGSPQTAYDLPNGATCVHDHNIYWRRDGSAEGDLGVTLGTGESFEDPLFTGATNNEFHLSDGSPAIGTAASLGYTTDFEDADVSSPPDIGAYAYSSGTPPNPENTATIRVTTNDGGYTAEATITLVESPGSIPVTGVTVSPLTATIYTSQTYQFIATVQPSNATNKAVTWSVVGGSVNGTVTSNGLYTAPISVPINGQVRVRATVVDDNTTFTADAVVSVIASTIHATSVVISPSVTTIQARTSLRFTAAVQPSNATNKAVTWSVLNGEGYGTIDSTGLYTAPYEPPAGPATVRVTTVDGGFNSDATVTIATAQGKPSIVTFTSNKATTISDEAILLSWQLSNPSNSGALNLDINGITLPSSNSGSRYFTISTTTKFTLTGSNNYGFARRSITVSATPRPTVTVTSPVNGAIAKLPFFVTGSATPAGADIEVRNEVTKIIGEALASKYTGNFIVKIVKVD